MRNITVVTINYNNAAGLKKTITSVENQLNQDFEWVIIDGGSKDNSVDLIKNTKRINAYKSEADNGIYDAMWKGLSISTGEYIVFLNSGDTFYDEHSISIIKDEISKCDRDLYLFSTQMIGLSKSHIRYPREISASIYSVPAVQQSTIYRKKSLENIDWPFNYKICGDFSIALQLYVNNASYTKNNSIISNFELGGVSTQKPMELTKEAFKIQRQFYKKSKILPYIYAIKRLITGCIVFVIYKAKNDTKSF